MIKSAICCMYIRIYIYNLLQLHSCLIMKCVIICSVWWLHGYFPSFDLFIHECSLCFILGAKTALVLFYSLCPNITYFCYYKITCKILNYSFFNIFCCHNLYVKIIASRLHLTDLLQIFCLCACVLCVYVCVTAGNSKSSSNLDYLRIFKITVALFFFGLYKPIV